MPSREHEEQSDAEWLAEQRAAVIEYLERQGVRHRGVAAEPAWFVSPYVALWPIGSMKAPGAIGWWAISGDVPTDYISTPRSPGVRSVMATFARQWHEVSEFMLRGEEHPDTKIGTPENRRVLGGLLRRRAMILQTWTDDGDMWDESGQPVPMDDGPDDADQTHGS